jgi:hypothetical protein
MSHLRKFSAGRAAGTAPGAVGAASCVTSLTAAVAGGSRKIIT